MPAKPDPTVPDVPVPAASVPVLIPVTVKEELASASVSPYKTSEVPSETVKV